MTATESTEATPVATPAPAALGSAEGIRSYHGQPVLKEPVWSWEIPCYFYTGGLTGAASGLAFLAELRGDELLARRAWAAAMMGGAASPILLISDLGKPERFLNMLRMFKVTSPMSVGSWILVAVGGSAPLAAIDAWTGLIPGGRYARRIAAVFGLPLATYTAALISNTAVPVWHKAHRMLPFVFGSGAAMSAGAATVALTPPAAAAPARRLALAGAVAGVATSEMMERRLGEQGEPYHHGAAANFRRVSRVAGAAGSILLATRGRSSRAAAVASGLLLSAAALSTRWSVFKAGFQSAADPKYVIGPQREAIRSGERRGGARREPRV
jgi:DMSO reductase anchor subunit